MAKMDAMGSRIGEITDLLAQRELRMEIQIRDMCGQIQTMNTTLQNTKLTAARSGVPLTNCLETPKPRSVAYATLPQNPRNVYPKPRFKSAPVDCQRKHRHPPRACAYHQKSNQTCPRRPTQKTSELIQCLWTHQY